jgi:hypothetical protein
LERPDVFAGATGFASTADIALVVPPFDWRHVAEAQRGAQLLTPDYDYRWYLGISEVQDYFASAPELSPVSFAEFLGSGQILLPLATDSMALIVIGQVNSARMPTSASEADSTSVRLFDSHQEHQTPNKPRRKNGS